jgi:peptide deformylase
MIRPIVRYNDPVLRTKGKPVSQVTEDLKALAADMIETMRNARGVGLAAQQVGVPLQLAVVDVSHDPECITLLKVNGEARPLADIMPLIFVNPRLELGKEKITAEEGCLSFPDLRENIRRSVQVKATLQTLDGETLVIETDGLLSRAIQHETDHLNGILFIDRLSAAAKIGLKRKIKRLMEEWAEDDAAAAEGR